MKKAILVSSGLLVFASSIWCFNAVKAASLSSSLSGRILLQVQSHGEAWYVNPLTKERHYLGRPTDAFNLMRSLGLGIKHVELAKYQSSSFPVSLSGRILLDVEKNGEAYYINPLNLKAYYLGRPADAFNIMRSLGLGITNDNLEKIAVNGQNKTTSGAGASGETKAPPAAAISACTGKAVGAVCSFSDNGGTASGVCDTKPGVLACAPNKTTGGNPGGSTPAKTTTTLPTAANSCINNTKDNPQCKDCCDCLSGIDSATRTACRNTCATHNFTTNSNLITVTAPSILGRSGDYSKALLQSTADSCKTYCENSMGLQCGDYQFCRLACDDKWGIEPGPGGESTGTGIGNSGSAGNQSNYTIEQAISDNAQLNTMAFDGLGFMTGNTCSDSFLPPGKVADFFGFQHLRDVTPDGNGHNTDFVTNSANNVLKTLNATQKAKMLALAKSQGASVNQFAYDRFPLMVAFRRQMTGDIPSGKTGLSKSAVMSYSSDLYALDAQISIERAELYAAILNSLDSTQKAFLDDMVEGGFASWASLPNQVDAGLSKEESVLMMTYASEMFGWYAGNLEADTYFCPERQADYFGGFYIKDAPAIGNAGYTIDESITGDKGQAFLNALDTAQRSTVTSVITTQKTALNGIVEKRRAISTLLRNALSGGMINEAAVISLARQYGAYDGEISYYYATAFSNVYKTLTSAQKTTLANIKGLSGYSCEDNSAYLYSEKINMPTVADTDFLFQ